MTAFFCVSLFTFGLKSLPLASLKVLTFGKNQINLFFLSLNRTFANGMEFKAPKNDMLTLIQQLKMEER